jgi:hypothetical protein
LWREARRIIRERQAAALRTELDGMTDAMAEAVGEFVARVRKELRTEFRGAARRVRCCASAR